MVKSVNSSKILNIALDTKTKRYSTTLKNRRCRSQYPGGDFPEADDDEVTALKGKRVVSHFGTLLGWWCSSAKCIRLPLALMPPAPVGIYDLQTYCIFYKYCCLSENNIVSKIAACFRPPSNYVESHWTDSLLLGSPYCFLPTRRRHFFFYCPLHHTTTPPINLTGNTPTCLPPPLPRLQVTKRNLPQHHHPPPPHASRLFTTYIARLALYFLP